MRATLQLDVAHATRGVRATRSEQGIQQRAHGAQGIGAGTHSVADHIHLHGARLGDAGRQFKVGVNLADGFLQVALQILVLHAADLDGADAGNEDRAAAVDRGADVDIYHAPAAHLQLVARADDIILIDLGCIKRREGGRHVAEQVLAINGQVLSCDACRIGLEWSHFGGGTLGRTAGGRVLRLALFAAAANGGQAARIRRLCLKVTDTEFLCDGER